MLLNFIIALVVVNSVICLSQGFAVSVQQCRGLRLRGNLLLSSVDSKIWAPNSWQKFPVKQAPNYPDEVNNQSSLICFVSFLFSHLKYL